MINVKETLESQERFQLENQRHLHRYVKDTLLPQLEMDLTRERGVWGPQEPCSLGNIITLCQSNSACDHYDRNGNMIIYIFRKMATGHNGRALPHEEEDDKE